MKKYCAFLMLSGMIAFQGLGQNLVVNPGFEELEDSSGLRTCWFIKKGEHFSRALTGWTSFSDRTPDLIRRDSGRTCLYPAPRHGRYLVGLITYHPALDTGYDFDYHEYIQGTFREPLTPGMTYRIEFWLSQSDTVAVRHLQSVYSPDDPVVSLAANRIGLKLLSERVDPGVTLENYRYWLPRATAFEESRIIRTGEGEWVKVAGTFTADKAYRFFLIGNFSEDAHTQVAGAGDVGQIDAYNRRKGFYYKKIKRVAYYCLDDVAVYPAAGHGMEDELAEAGRYVFRAVNFRTGSAALLPEAFPELDALVDFLRARPSVRIEIAGHTDNVGAGEDNMRLSEERAGSVRDYLSRGGIDAERLRARGYGETQPVADNGTAEGRRRNRRVECRLLDP